MACFSIGQCEKAGCAIAKSNMTLIWIILHMSIGSMPRLTPLALSKLNRGGNGPVPLHLGHSFLLLPYV